MATHTHTTTTSRRPATPSGTGGRRSLAAGIAALALAAPALVGAEPVRHRTVLDPTPDADLLTLYAQHARNHAAVNALDAPDWEDEEHPLWLAYAASYQAVKHTRPRTLEGVLAKARLAQLEDFVPKDGDEDASDWVGIVIKDLLWLADGGAA